MLKLHLDHIDAFDAAIARIDKEVDANLDPFRAAIETLSTIPGVSGLSADIPPSVLLTKSTRTS